MALSEQLQGIQFRVDRILPSSKSKLLLPIHPRYPRSREPQYINMFKHSSIARLLVASTIHLRLVLGWGRQNCITKVNETVWSNDSSLNPAWFTSLADPNNIKLTVEGCEAICDKKMGFYPDSAPRLITWLLPVILLIGNMQFAPIGKEKFFMVVHLLGDPIHSAWSLLAKLEDWYHCFSYIRRQYPIKPSPQQEYRIKTSMMVLVVAGELFAPFDIGNRLDFLIPNEGFDDILWETASALGESRKTELLRAVLAVSWYIFDVVAAFVPAVGQSPNASGGRIAPAMLLSWLLPVVLLSNAIGGFSSLRNCRIFVTQYLARIDRSRYDISICEDQRSRLFKKNESTPYFTSLAWSGAIYSYRLGKRPSGTPRRSLLLALCSLLPVTLAFGLAFAALETAPTYFSCRSVLVIAIFASWLVSASITWVTSLQNSVTGKYLWYFILIKDAIIAVPALALIIATSCGLFNSCYCWSGALVLGRSKASVALDPVSAFNRNDEVVYPAMVATGLFLQVSVFLLVMWAGRRCLGAMSWSNDIYPEGLEASTQSQASATGAILEIKEGPSRAADREEHIQPQIGSSTTIVKHEKGAVISQENSAGLVSVGSE